MQVLFAFKPYDIKAKDRYKSPEDNPMYGKKQSEKTKMAVREAQSKPVVQLTKSGELIAEYKSGAEAERITGVLSGGISSCCVGRYISAGGFLWVNKKLNLIKCRIVHFFIKNYKQQQLHNKTHPKFTHKQKAIVPKSYKTIPKS